MMAVNASDIVNNVARLDSWQKQKAIVVKSGHFFLMGDWFVEGLVETLVFFVTKNSKVNDTKYKKKITYWSDILKIM